MDASVIVDYLNRRAQQNELCESDLIWVWQVDTIRFANGRFYASLRSVEGHAARSQSIQELQVSKVLKDRLLALPEGSRFVYVREGNKQAVVKEPCGFKWAARDAGDEAAPNVHGQSTKSKVALNYKDETQPQLAHQVSA